MPVTSARKSAYRNLMRIEIDRAFSSEVLAGSSEEMSLQDRNLCYKLTLGVLRNQMKLDYAVSLFSRKPPRKLDFEVLTILRLAIFQLHFLDRIPDYSVINESVELTRFARKSSASGFVNAVLRKASKWDGRISESDTVKRVALENSHPEWLIENWSNEFGIQKAESLAKANNHEPRAAFRFTEAFDDLDPSAKDSIKRSINSDQSVTRSSHIEGGYIVERVHTALQELVEQGLIYFQDEASQLASLVTSNLAKGVLLDLCAAPGSKATLISRLGGEDLRIIASDIHLHRARHMQTNALRQHTSVSVLCLDGTDSLPFENQCFDTILVDAPCSGTGTIRRNPEIRYRVTPETIDSLHNKQLRLLEEASKFIKQGGVLIYSTCSLERAENQDVVREFIGKHSDFGMIDPGMQQWRTSEQGIIRTYPDVHGTDGFFIACLQRQ